MNANIVYVVIEQGVLTGLNKGAFRNCSNLKTINYKGSKEQWDSISKGYSWNGDTDDYTINYNYKED